MDNTMLLPRPGARLLTLALSMLGGVLAPSAAQAQSAVYLCVDATGRKELTDGYKPGCKALDIPGAIPAPRSRGAAPARSAAPVSTPADFPKVDNALQKARDSDRRAILVEELESEQAKLTQLRINGKGSEPKLAAENISRSEKNIEALKREIANIK
jgi:hypothetical protein